MTIDIEPIKKQIADLESQLKNPLPTPPVGMPVVWYAGADVRDGAERAGIVTSVLGPGKITVTVFGPSAMPSHFTGCLYLSHPAHEQRNNAVSRNSGAWGYLPGTSTPKSHLTQHIEQLEKRKSSLKAQLEDAKSIQESEPQQAEKTVKA